MRTHGIFEALLQPARRSRVARRRRRHRREESCRNAAHKMTHSEGKTQNTRNTPRRRGQESGYAFLFVLGLMLVMIAVSLTALQMGATIRRRRIDQETIWRGNKYARAILPPHSPKARHSPPGVCRIGKREVRFFFPPPGLKKPQDFGGGLLGFHHRNGA